MAVQEGRQALLRIRKLGWLYRSSTEDEVGGKNLTPIVEGVDGLAVRMERTEKDRNVETEVELGVGVLAGLMESTSLDVADRKVSR